MMPEWCRANPALRGLYLFARDRRRQLVFSRIKYFCDFSFIHINKNGGSSIEHALGLPLVHETAQVVRSRIGPKRWEERFSFSIVRNPWDRAVSHFHYRYMTNQTRVADRSLSFKQWLRHVYLERSPEYVDDEKMFLSQTDWVCDEDGEVMVDYIGQFENLATAWVEICEHLGREPLPLPHHKRSSRGDYRSYYDADSRDIVATFFRTDIERFGYEFE
jgi:hypothetical protein